MELVTGILAKAHSGFDEFVFIAETGKIASVSYTHLQRAFAYLQLLDSGKYTHEQILEVLQFLQKQLYCRCV